MIKASVQHGAALRVPSPDNPAAWSVLCGWLGEAGRRLSAEAIVIAAAQGEVIATVGDWVVLSSDGDYHVGACGSGARSLS